MILTDPRDEIEIKPSEFSGMRAWKHVEIAPACDCYLICTVNDEGSSTQWYLVATPRALLEFLDGNETHGKVASICQIGPKGPGAVEPRVIRIGGWESGVVIYPENGPPFAHSVGSQSPCGAHTDTLHQPDTEVRPGPGDGR